MKTIKLKIHSIVDLITNSSTVIFTYSEDSLPALKRLVNEMLKSFDKVETFDDIFYADVFLSYNDDYLDAEVNFDENNQENYVSIFRDLSYLEKCTKLSEIKSQILKGEIEKPQWMTFAEEYNGDYSHETTLEILPKDDKYLSLADKLISFLYSTDHEASYE